MNPVMRRMRTVGIQETKSCNNIDQNSSIILNLTFTFKVVGRSPSIVISLIGEPQPLAILEITGRMSEEQKLFFNRV